MHSLDQAVQLALRWTTERRRERAELMSELEALIRDAEEAIEVWQGYLAAPETLGDRWSILSWIGPERVKKLHEINLRAKDHIYRIAQLMGPPMSRFVSFDADFVEMAYRQLQTTETGMDAANAAIKQMRERIAHVRTLLERLRAAPLSNTLRKKTKIKKSSVRSGRSHAKRQKKNYVSKNSSSAKKKPKVKKPSKKK